ncbi:MAG: flavin reductase family protein [Pseudomonadota bacterium]
MNSEEQHRRLRDAFGQFATGITVITTLDQNDQPVGITANSFASVSLQPPLVSWCIDKSATRYDEFATAEYYSISILNSQQRATSDLFAMRSWDSALFDEVDWFAGPHGIPQLPDVLARFHCKTDTIYEGGDHLIIVGLVEQFDSNPAAPLVFFQGDYLTVDSENETDQ